MRIRVKDKVKVISGKDRGKEGMVEKVLILDGKIIVHGINIAKRHVKPGKASKEGGIMSIERPLSISNVMILCEKCARPVRIGYSIVNGKKIRICKKCGGVFDK